MVGGDWVILRQGNRVVGDVLRQSNRGTKALHKFL